MIKFVQRSGRHSALHNIFAAVLSSNALLPKRFSLRARAWHTLAHGLNENATLGVRSGLEVYGTVRRVDGGRQ